MAGIIWLASYPKSGNTWLRAFLANLLHGGDRPVPLNSLPDFVFGDGFLVHYGQLAGKPAESLSHDEIMALRPRLHAWLARARAPDDVFVKTHSALLVADGVPLITPDATAGAVYVVRNPFDVAVSFAHHYQVSLERAVEALCDPEYVLPPSGGQGAQVIADWTTHYRSWTTAPGLTRHVVRYEDMARAPESTFTALAQFLGLEADRARLDRAIRFSAFDELAAQERREGFVEARPDKRAPFFRRGRVGGWREVLTREQVARLSDCHRDLLLELGYLDAPREPRV